MHSLRPAWLFALAAAALAMLRAIGAEGAGPWIEAWIGRNGADLQWAMLALFAWRMALAWEPLRTTVARALSAEETTEDLRIDTRQCFVAGLVVTCVALAGLEWRSPYFFAQDDNHAQFMPVIVRSCEQLFRGTFPVWNAHQMMGAPSAVVGTYALTYPLTWLSYAIARWGLGDVFALCDVFAMLHLTAGYVATWHAARKVGLSAPLAAAGAVSFVLSGFMLVMGRSWFYMTPVALWVPLLAAQIEGLRRTTLSTRWPWVTGTVIGALFHAGNAQMWTYALLLTSLAAVVLAATANAPRAHLRACVAAVALGLALAAPLLVPQLEFVGGITRRGGTGDGLRNGLLHMVLPWPLVRAARPNGMGSTHDDLRTMGQLYYAGTLFSAMGIALAVSLASVRLSRAAWRANVWALTATVALLLGLGHAGVLWALMAKLPVLSRFSRPFKLLPFVTLFSMLGGGLALQRLLAGSRRAHVALSLLVGALMLWHCAVTRASEYTWADRPYPPLDDVLRAHVLDTNPATRRRVLAIGPERSILPGFSLAMHVNHASAYGALSAHGFDPLVEGTPETLEVLRHTIDAPFSSLALGYRRAATHGDRNPVPALRRWGVRYILTHTSAFAPVRGANPTFAFMEVLDPAGQRHRDAILAAARRVATLPTVTLWALDDVDPLAFMASDPTRALRFEVHGAGVHVPLAGAEGAVIVNVRWRPLLRASVDGVVVPCRRDAWGRVEVRVPRGARSLDVRFVVPWARGFALGAVLWVVALACMRRAMPSACA